MKLFGLKIQKAMAKAESNISSAPQFRDNPAQGWMTNWFNNYYTRKVSGDFYEILREGIPIIDAAIRRLISLNGTIKIIGDNGALVRELDDFCLSVPVNDKQKGIHAFLENASNEVFEQGFTVAEFVSTPDMSDIAGLRVADSKQIVFRKNADGGVDIWYRFPGNLPQRSYSRPESIVQQILTATYSQAVWINGLWEEKLTPGNKLYFSINNENSDPYGVSIMRSMEFCAKILMTMQNSLQNVWERFGDPSFFVKYKTTKRDLGGTDVEARRQKIQTDFNAAIRAKREGKSADFVTAVNADADMTIEVIGHDNQILQLDVPARHVLEQIVSKTNLPAWMLGVYWSTTERMATLEVESALQDAKIRQLAMLPEFIRLFSTLLKLRGRKWKTITTDIEKPGDWGLVFETPNLRDLVSQAQARFLSAQADMMERGGVLNPQSQIRNPKTDVNIDGASIEINGMKFPIFKSETVNPKSEIKCGCEHHTKELNRPTPWPQLDAVESEYEARLKKDWQGLQEKVFEILKLTDIKSVAGNSEIQNPKSKTRNSKLETRNSKSEIRNPKSEIKGIPALEAFAFSDEQRALIMDALKQFTGIYDWRETDSPVRWYYGQSYSLGLIQAAKMIGKDQPILNIIKNQEIFEELIKTGFDYVKDNATMRISGSIMAEMEAQMLAGTNPTHVAARLKARFGEANSDWERLARSEMSMAAENAKVDEWGAWGINVDDAVIPVQDTHPRCKCSNSMREIDGEWEIVFTPAPDACPICMALAQ